MNQSKNLILKNGEDITGDVISCVHNLTTHKYDITYRSGKTYSHNYFSIDWMTEPRAINPNLVRITRCGEMFFNIDAIYVFRGSTEYWHIRFSSGKEKTYSRHDLDIAFSCLNDDETKNVLEYLRQISAVNELKNDDGEVLLQKQYENLRFVDTDTAMMVYLNPAKYKAQVFPESNPIFPFGGNASQFKAVRNAMGNQISVIQGPPGTGKTQTILNIIANLLASGKTVQIVSNNNSATRNVLEKLALPQYNLGFLAAPLGNKNNKTAFIENQTETYPDMSGWKLGTVNQFKLREKIEARSRELADLFAAQERLSQIRLERDSLNLEITYFDQYCKETGFVSPEKEPKHKLDSQTIMRLWQECGTFSEKWSAFLFLFKIKCVFIYRIAKFKFFRNSLSLVITLFQKLFYQSKILELNSEIVLLENRLQTMDAKTKMKELTEWSMDYLRAKLFERYGEKPERKLFAIDDLWKNPHEVIREYPVVLSTTFSSYSSLRGVTFDYIIMDEASQVDVATGALALSCAKNAVIVGDLKQLPNVVTGDMKLRCDAIFDSYKLPQAYSFSGNSFLKSVCDILPDIPQTLLREHYRCHPRIIGFCNQKFYHNDLIIMTEDHGEPDTLAVFKTAPGDHRRGHVNQRQIDITLEEALPSLGGINPENIGIIAPYRDHVETMKRQIKSGKIEVDTVHKFQGREKDTIVLTTVDDAVTDFSDDPYLLNVAISRAQNHLILVVSGNEQAADSNINDLISYIEYNNGTIIESEVYSVFDMLYRQYTDARIAFLKKHRWVSIYDSENLMYGIIVDILAKYQNQALNVICHQPLNMLIRDRERLNADERRYVTNAASHVDFLVYTQIGKKSVLAIEVDGFHYHKSGTRQHERDRMKDRILEYYGIPLLRLPTNGSGEQSKIKTFLDGYAGRR